MTVQEFLLYKMNKEEVVKWSELVDDIKTHFIDIIKYSTDVPYSVLEDTLNRTLMAREPWCESKGYINNHGYYYVQEGDRGAITLIFSGYTYEMARNFLVNRCADRIAYAYVTYDIDRLRDKHKEQWHYCRIDDGLEKEDGVTRLKSHLEEQEDWIYDAEYDYRLYWFEFVLYMVKRILDKEEYEKCIKYNEGCLNCDVKRHWVFNRETEKFELEKEM